MRFAWLSLTLLAAAAACAQEPVASRETGVLGQALEAAAAEHALPASLLMAIVETEEGLDVPLQRSVPTGHADLAQAGPMRLRHAAFDSLAAAAREAQVDEHALREDGVLALRAGSAVLASLLRDAGVRFDALGLIGGSWSDVQHVLERWSGYADGWHQRDYARRVLAAMARGLDHENAAGEWLHSAPFSVPPALLIPEPRLAPLALPDFPGAEVLPLNPNKPNKFEPGRADGATVQFIVIHDTEGGWDASASTLQNSDSTSVHYMIGTDGRLAQFMPEADTGKHSGNVYYNRRSIGIEHVGYSTQHFPEAEYLKSAELVRHLVDKYEVPTDRAHIIGHDQVPSDEAPNKIAADAPPCDKSPADCARILYYGGRNHHTDPGVWEWGTYMHRIGGAAKCNDVTGAMSCDSTLHFAVGCVEESSVSVLECDGACRPANDDAPLVCRPVIRAVDGGTGGSDGGEDGGEGDAPDAGTSSSGDKQPGRSSSSGGASSGAGPTEDAADDGGCSITGRQDGAWWWLGALWLARRRRTKQTV